MYFYNYISQIQKYFDEKEYEKTIELLFNASFTPDVEECYIYAKTALCYELLNDEQNAEKYYNFAKKLITQKQHYIDVSVFNNYAEYFYKKGNYEDALTGLNIILESTRYTLKSLILQLTIYEKINFDKFINKLKYLYQINPFAKELIEIYKANNLNNYDDSFLINKFEELKKISKDGKDIFIFIENNSLLSEKEFNFYANALNKVGITVDSFIIYLFNKYNKINDKKIIIYKNILAQFDKDKLNEIAKVILTDNFNGISLINILLQIDKEYYKKFTENIIIKSRYKYNEYINFLNDIEFYKKYTKEFFKSEDFSEKDFNSLILFLENGEKNENFNSLINVLGKKYFYNSYSHISENLLKDLHNFEFTDFYKRVFEICFYGNKEGTLKIIIGKDYEFKSKLKLFEHLDLNKHDIIAFFLESYYKTASEKRENIDIENGLNYFLKNNFTEVIKQINKSEKKKITYFIDLLWNFDKEKTFKIIFDFIHLNTKPVLRRIYNFFSKYEKGFEAYKSLLNEEKKDIYELGIKILSKFKNDETDKLFNKLLLDENRYEFIKIIRDYFEIKKLLEEKLITLKEVELLEMLYSETQKEKSLYIKDINVKTLPDLYFKHNNKVVDLNIKLYLFKLASKNNKVIPTQKLIAYCGLINRENINIFAKEVYSRWNTENKSIWFLKFVSLFANDDLGDIIKKDIVSFSNSLRWLVASNITPILGFIKTDKSIESLKRIISKVTSDKVIQAAHKAIKNIKTYFAPAKVDYYDSIIPNYGFDKNGVLNFKYKNRLFDLKVDSEFNIILEDEKYIYSKLPNSDSSNEEHLISSKINRIIKEIPKETQLQIKKFEYYLCNGKFLNIKNPDILLNNYIMKQIMSKLIWGYYENNKLIKSFAINELNLFVDYNNIIVPFEESYKIRIIHPVELIDEELIKWNDFLINKNINQPFKQLNRLTFDFSENEKNISFINSKKMTPAEFKNKLINNNYKGDVVENEFIIEKYVENYETLINISFTVNIKDDCINTDKINFYKNNIKLNEINKILYSETISEIIQ